MKSKEKKISEEVRKFYTFFPDHLKEIVDYVFEYVDGNSNDWFRIKKELANMFPPEDRKRFSKRHFSTKKHILNSFDKMIITYWENKSGKKLWIDPSKLHLKNWVQKPVGWGLQEINEERKRQKEKRISGSSGID